MEAPSELPKIGDRIRLHKSGPFFVVVAIDKETRTVSVLPEDEVTQADIDALPIAHNN